MPADNPQPGDRFTKNGVESTIKAVERGQVYFVRYRAGGDHETLDGDGCPVSFLGANRIDLDVFFRDVVGAEYVKAW